MARYCYYLGSLRLLPEPIAQLGRDVIAQHRRDHTGNRRRHQNEGPQQKREDHTRDGHRFQADGDALGNMRQRQSPVAPKMHVQASAQVPDGLQPMQYYGGQKAGHAGQCRNRQQQYVYRAVQALLSSAVRAAAEMGLVITTQA